MFPPKDAEVDLRLHFVLGQETSLLLASVARSKMIQNTRSSLPSAALAYVLQSCKWVLSHTKGNFWEGLLSHQRQLQLMYHSYMTINDTLSSYIRKFLQLEIDHACVTMAVLVSFPDHPHLALPVLGMGLYASYIQWCRHTIDYKGHNLMLN